MLYRTINGIKSNISLATCKKKKESLEWKLLEIKYSEISQMSMSEQCLSICSIIGNGQGGGTMEVDYCSCSFTKLSLKKVLKRDKYWWKMHITNASFVRNLVARRNWDTGFMI